MGWKTVASLVAIVAGLLGIAATWITLGFPVPASRQYVNERLHPIMLQQLKTRRHIDAVDLYQWKLNPVITQGIQVEIDRLQAEINALDKAIEGFEQ